MKDGCKIFTFVTLDISPKLWISIAFQALGSTWSLLHIVGKDPFPHVSFPHLTHLLALIAFTSVTFKVNEILRPDGKCLEYTFETQLWHKDNVVYTPKQES